MKLKELLPKKTIDVLVQNREQRREVFATDLKGVIDERGTILNKFYEKNPKNLLKKIKPYVLGFVTETILEEVKEKDMKYYNKLYSDIRDYKGETEINMKALLGKSRSLRGINQILGFYH